MANRQTFTQQDIESFHWVRFPGLNGEVLFALSGIIRTETKGDSQNWLGVPITCKIDIPTLPQGQGFFIYYHAPFAALNSVFNQNQSINSGHSVNTCKLKEVNPDGNFGSNTITLELGLAVRDNDAYLHRVGFNIMLAGVIRPLKPVDPCKAEVDKLTELEHGCGGAYQAIIDSLRASLPTATPQQKGDINRAIGQLEEKIRSCPVDLGNARNALNRCRISQTSSTDLPVTI
jgi:hypothetical protein